MIPSILGGYKDQLGFAFSKIDDGNMAYTWGEKSEVSANRDTFWQKAGVELKNSVGMMLAHGTELRVVDQSDAGKGTQNDDDYYDVDALITNTKGLVLYVLTADCCPIILFDPVKAALGLVHASWKNTDQEFVKKVVATMQTTFKTNPADLKVFIAPAIHPQSYAFSKNDEHIAQRDKPNWQPYLEEKAGRVHIDVVSYNIDQLVEGGVLRQNIEDSGIDTYSSKDYFSHRQSVVESLPEGRLATLAWLK